MWTDKNRAKYNRDHLRYPSDLTDEEWAHIEPLIPPAKSGGGKRRTDMRAVMDGVMYILSTGCQWRYIPNDFPPRSTLHDYFTWWNCDGTLNRIHHALYVECREKAEREASPTACIIDSQSVKSAEKGGPMSILTGWMRASLSRARSGIFSSTCRVCCCTRSFSPPAFRIATVASHCLQRCSANFHFSENYSATALMRAPFSTRRSPKSCPTSKLKSSNAPIRPKGLCHCPSVGS
jgi:transposase